MKGINELSDLVRNLHKEFTYQNAEIKHIQTLIENCGACQVEVEPRDNCQHANPCFTGNEYRTDNGGLITAIAFRCRMS